MFNVTNSVFQGSIDEVKFYAGKITNIHERLYDAGFKLNVTGCYMDDTFSQRMAWFQFRNPGDSQYVPGAIVSSSMCVTTLGLNNHLTASFRADPRIDFSVESILEEPYAEYIITAKEKGPQYDAQISHVSPACHNTWFDFTDVAGGADPRTLRTPHFGKFIDIVTSVPCGECKVESLSLIHI